jgi:hypothetical protein
MTLRHLKKKERERRRRRRREPLILRNNTKTGFNSAKISAVETASSMDVEQNSAFTQTEYILVIAD